METPIKKEIVDGLVAELGIEDFAKATIREAFRMVSPIPIPIFRERLC